MGMVWLMINAVRVPSGGNPTQDLLPISLQSLDPLLNGELSQEEIEELQEQLANILVGESVPDPCGTASGTTEYTVSFDVPGPKKPDAADRGLVMVGLGTAGWIPEGRNKEQIRQLIQDGLSGDQQIGETQSVESYVQQQLDRARPGSYNGSVRINGSISLKAVD